MQELVPNAPCGVKKRVVRKCLILVFYKLYDALGGAHNIFWQVFKVDAGHCKSLLWACFKNLKKQNGGGF